ncbi:MAG: hypothetical protein Q8932_21715, partial [Bacteroidota bacterium]|nr:hypothetical protein [Bacteroidota bacterium]
MPARTTGNNDHAVGIPELFDIILDAGHRDDALFGVKPSTQTIEDRLGLLEYYLQQEMLEAPLFYASQI